MYQKFSIINKKYNIFAYLLKVDYDANLAHG